MIEHGFRSEPNDKLGNSTVSPVAVIETQRGNTLGSDLSSGLLRETVARIKTITTEDSDAH